MSFKDNTLEELGIIKLTSYNTFVLIIVLIYCMATSIFVGLFGKFYVGGEVGDLILYLQIGF